MMVMQGFSGARLGLCTRRVLSGGSRMGLCLPVMVGDGAGAVRGRASTTVVVILGAGEAGDDGLRESFGAFSRSRAGCRGVDGSGEWVTWDPGGLL